jgi:AcrR family transcriptional regulator
MNKPRTAVRKRGEASQSPRRQEDPRVLRTKRALGGALVELMLAEDFDAITVQRVLERAGVGRSTFYAHYRNTNDLLLSDAERFLNLLEEHFERVSGNGNRLAPVTELFHHVREFRDFERALERSGKSELIYGLFAGHLARMIAKRIRTLVPGANDLTVPIPVASRMFAGALVELLRWWLDRDTTYTPAWVDERYHELVWFGLRGMTPGAERL